MHWKYALGSVYAISLHASQELALLLPSAEDVSRLGYPPRLHVRFGQARPILLSSLLMMQYLKGVPSSRLPIPPHLKRLFKSFFLGPSPLFCSSSPAKSQ